MTTDYAGHARAVAETWASEHLDGTIIGIGGDGTLNEITNACCLRPTLSAAALSSLSAAAAMPMISTGVGHHHERVRLEGAVGGTRCGGCPRGVLQGQEPHRAHPTVRTVICSDRCFVHRGFRRQRSPTGHARRSCPDPSDIAASAAVSWWSTAQPTRADSLSWHIIPTMAKVFRASANSRRADGLMEVVLIPHRRWPTALRMSWFGLRALVWPQTTAKRENDFSVGAGRCRAVGWRDHRHSAGV